MGDLVGQRQADAHADRQLAEWRFVAIHIGFRLFLELQTIRCRYRLCRLLGREAAQDIQHHLGGRRPSVEGQLTGYRDRIHSLDADGLQDRDKLPVTAWLPEQLVLLCQDRSRQFPDLEGRTIAQRAGLSVEGRHAMPAIETGLVPLEAADVVSVG